MTAATGLIIVAIFHACRSKRFFFLASWSASPGPVAGPSGRNLLSAGGGDNFQRFSAAGRRGVEARSFQRGHTGSLIDPTHPLP